MGLSNEERITGLFYDIKNIVSRADALKEESDCPRKFVEIIDQLWFAFLGQTRNSAHWILGSSATNQVAWDTVSPWGVAINHHTQDLIKEESDIFSKDRFDAFDRFLDVPGLLGQAGMIYKNIYEIFAYSEQAAYHLRRYEDELSKDLKGLSKLLADIQGECFQLFIDDQTYARAYVLNIITKMVYGPHYPYSEEKWDPLTKYLSKECIHHDLSRMMQPRDADMKMLATLHIKMHRAKEAKKLTIALRTEAMLQLVGRRFHYDQKFAELKVALRRRVNSKEMKALQTLFNKCKKEHDEDEKTSMKNAGGLSPLSIYGLSVK
jgi:chorismate mutase